MTVPAPIEAAPQRPKIAVVVPIFKHSALLSDAIESVLAQTCIDHIQLLLVNDGCPHPETDAVCRDYAHARPECVTYLRKANGGLSDARNHGIEFALKSDPRIDAIYLLDADNRLRPEALSRAMDRLERDPKVDWVYPNIDMFGVHSAHDYGGAYSPFLHSAMNVCEAGSLVHRRVFDAGLRFDTSFKQGFEDWEFFVSALNSGFRGANLENFGFQYRKRPESMLSAAEREGAGIRAAIHSKHAGFFAAKHLATREHIEAPRYAIYLSDTKQILLQTDPDCAGETLSVAEYDVRVWQSQINPSRFGRPPFLVVTTHNCLERLRKVGMLHWSFWQLELELEHHPFAVLRLTTHPQDRITVRVTQATSGQHLGSDALIIAPTSLRGALADPDPSWMNSIGQHDPAPTFGHVALQVPEVELSKPPPNGGTAIKDALALFDTLHGSEWREASNHALEWRVGDIADIRENSHRILRNRLEGSPAFPRIETQSRTVGLTLPLVEFGGVEKVALNVARELKAAGYSVHLFVLWSKDASISAEWRANTDSVSFLGNSDFAPWGGAARRYMGTELPRWAEYGDHGPLLALLYWLDVVIDFHGGAAVATMAKLRKLGVTTVSSLHLSDLSMVQRPVGNTYLTMAYEHAFDILAPCSLRLGDWLHAMGVPQDKIIPVPNAPGFPLTEDVVHQSHRAKAGQSTDAPLKTLFLGRLDPQKGLGRLTTVLEHTAPDLIDWRIIGKPVVEQGKQTVSDAIARALEPPLSRAEDLAQAFEWADVLVLLSEYEGLPLTILEAMRQGVVVVATDVGSVSEVVHDGENGVVIPLEDASTRCMDALYHLADDRTRLRRLSARAASDAQHRTWRNAAGPLIARLDDMLSQKQR